MVCEYTGLQETHDACRIELAQLLDRAHDDKVFKQRDKGKPKHLILSIIDHG